MAASSLSAVFSFLVPTKSPPLPQTKTHPFSFSLKTSQKPKKASNFTVLASTQEYQRPHLSTEVSSVINPSLAHSNTLFFKGYNVQVVVDDNEPEERLLNRFRREVMKAGVIQECKRRRFFENKQDKEKRKTREAAKRNRRRRPQSRMAPPSRPETPTNKKSNDDEDNWDLPEEDIPY